MELPPVEAGAALHNLTKVERIVVLMMENRSFDHMLGYLTLQKGRSDINGLTGGEVEFYDGNTFRPHHLDYTALPKPMDPDHSPKGVKQQLEEGFVKNFAETHLDHRELAGMVMGYFDADDLPAYDFLADQFCVCDRWHSSVAGDTWPNRTYALTGRSARSHLWWVPTWIPFGRKARSIPWFSLRSFARHLDRRKVGWRWYSHDPGTLRAVDRRYRLARTEHFRFFDKRAPTAEKRELLDPIVDLESGFLDDAANGDLPRVSWIDPNFVDLPIFDPDSDDDHPPSDVKAGQHLVLAAYHALRNSPHWDDTLLVITYDEHGGFFDHVKPTPPAEDDREEFRQYGVRVPALLVSPWVEGGSVCKELFDHTSIIKTILLKFCRESNGSIPGMGRRVEHANNLGAALTRETPREDIADHTDAIHQVVEWRRTRHEGDLPRPFARPPRLTEETRKLNQFQSEWVETSRKLRKKGLPAAHP